MTPTQQIVVDALNKILGQNDELIKILKELALPSRPVVQGMDFIEVPAVAATDADIVSADTSETDTTKVEVIDDKALIVPVPTGTQMHTINKPRKKSDGRGIPVWQRYAEAYGYRYKVEPVRNAMTNRICSQLADRLGANAGDVVSYYVQHNDFFYVKNAHALQYCLKDAEKLHMEWQRGRRVTTAEARQQDRQGHNAQVVEAVLEEPDYIRS